MHSNWRKDVLTVKETALMLHVSVPTIRRMIHGGILNPSPIRMGSGRGVTVIPRDEVEHYIEALKASARRSVDVGA